MLDPRVKPEDEGEYIIIVLGITMPQTLLTLENLTLGYGKVHAVSSLNGVINKGDLFAITGPNGGGKSTLIKALVGFIKPISGRIKWASKKPKLAYLPQQTEIDMHFPVTVQGLVSMGVVASKGLWYRLKPSDTADVLAAIKTVGLEGFEQQIVGTLSGGQFQRALFARLMVQQADIIVLDEPFTALDYATMHDLVHLLMDWQKQGKTIIAVLHDMEVIRSHFPRTLLLAREQVAWGETQETLCTYELNSAREKAKMWEF